MSTFVDSPLKIELIGTGEQAGTWGTTTNTNLKALQEAITGSATVSFSSADVTLTFSDTNGTQTARNLRLVCTGTSGGARNLILGSGCQIEKLYLIQNDLQDALTVKNTTGTGATVAAGEKKFVYNDGTNVVDAVTESINLTSEVTGTLPIANGGTNTTTTPTDGGVAYGTGSAYAFSTAGTSGYALISQGTGSAPTWQQVTDSNTVSTIVARDASGNFSAGTITATLNGASSSCSGNAATATTATTATTLQTARLINNTSFNGSADITVATSVTNASNNADYELALLPGTSTEIYYVYASSAGPTVNAQTGTMTVAGGIIGNASSATSLSTVTGSAPSYAARAWVNFIGEGTSPGQNVGVRDSGNVTSVVDQAAGTFRINFTTSMVDNDYACVGSAGNGSATRFAGPISFFVNYCVVITESQDGSNTDFFDNCFVFFR
jgi:hypothetical protein